MSFSDLKVTSVYLGGQFLKLGRPYLCPELAVLKLCHVLFQTGKVIKKSERGGDLETLEIGYICLLQKLCFLFLIF